MEGPLTTERLTIRNRTVDDADAAWRVHGSPDVARWLTPAMDRGHAVAAMRFVQWVGETTKYYDLRLQVYRVRHGDLVG